MNTVSEEEQKLCGTVEFPFHVALFLNNYFGNKSFKQIKPENIIPVAEILQILEPYFKNSLAKLQQVRAKKTTVETDTKESKVPEQKS